MNSSVQKRMQSTLTVASFFLLFVSSPSRAFNPFNLKNEFDEKLSSQQLLASTKYFALGERFKPGEAWDQKKFLELLKKNNFRVRNDGQMLLAEDATQLMRASCEVAIGFSISNESVVCWKWLNKQGALQLIVVQDQVILETYAGNPLKKSFEAAFDPVLAAQYKNNEPLIQEEKKLSDIPVACMNAVMAIEDNDFLDHFGVSYIGLARAILKNIMTLRKAQGGSTITQQLVKNYFLTSEKSYARKAKELYMAIRLESQWTKDEILSTYLNIIYMGQSGVFQVRGFPAASQYYFGKSVDQLNVPECALLAAIINNPLMNNPWKKSEHALNRRTLVLKKMYELKLISLDQQTQSLAYPLPAANQLRASETAPYFFEAVRRQAEELGIDPEGKSFFTTLDIGLQNAAQSALSEGILKVTSSREKLKIQKTSGVELQGSILSTENKSGHVNVFVGGQNFKTTQYNRALNSRRQIGSLVKPLIYLAGLIYGDFTPTTMLQDEPFAWEYDKKKWSPVNYDKKFRGPVPYYYALKESLNSPTAQVAQKAELNRIILLMKKIGFESEIPVLPAISLGVSEHTPLEVLQAYQTLARLGNYKKLTFITTIQDETGKIIFDDPYFDGEQVYDVKKAAELIGMMKQSVQSGTAKSLSTLTFSSVAAGKTGTTSKGKDTWFSGFTPNITTVVWIGFDQNLPTTLTGASGAVPIWGNYMKVAVPHYGTEDFLWPEGITAKEYEFPDLHEKVKLMVE
ncbi:MAG: transglycosylase domain-containing protein [Moraxellaceae bacterium]|nr:transglycosylase domain-containing protein [Pseudobdellovibrionaceae bacterium]